MIEEPPTPPAPEPPVPSTPGPVAAWVARWCERPIRSAGQACFAFASLAWRGFALGALAAALGLALVLGTQAGTGLGLVPDLILALLLGGLLTLAFGLGVLLLRLVLARMPWRFAFATLGALGLLVLLLCLSGAPAGFGIAAALTVVAVAGGVGAGAGGLVTGWWAGWRHRSASAVLLLLALGMGALLARRLADPGEDPWLRPLPPPRDVETIQAPDPGAPGLWKTASLTYGSGSDRRRTEFGSGAALRTPSVDATKLLPDFVGWKARVRKWYWGFGREAFPLDGRVTYPVGSGPFPLVLAVHGNHTASAPSDAGYRYLGELLASRGFIFVSVDETFLNGSWEGGVDKENAARAWILLKHLEAWRRWNQEPGNPFHGKVDLDRIALVGHSRGGEAVTTAAVFNRLPCDPEDASLAFDFGFGIRAVAAIAPIDGQYEPSGQAPALRDTNFLVLQGSHDADVSFFAGTRPYQRATFPGGGPGFKAALWIYRADHAQFNSEWGARDFTPPLGWLLNRGPLLSGEDQRRVAKVCLSAFLEASLHDRDEYVGFFRDPASGAAWLPPILVVNRFQTAGFHPVVQFGESLDLTRPSTLGTVVKGEDLDIWKLGQVQGRDEWPFRFSAVTLGWNAAAGRHPRLVLTLPPLGLELTGNSRLALTLAATRDSGARPAPGTTEPVDFSVELVAEDGTTARLPLASVRPLLPPVDVRFTKWAALDAGAFASSWEPVFQTFEIPLARFKEVASPRTLQGLTQIRLLFDRTPKGTILLERVGFEP
jgi:hypothetical protein